MPAQGNHKIACGQGTGGKTFCIRRRTENDTTLCLFPPAPHRARTSVDRRCPALEDGHEEEDGPRLLQQEAVFLTEHNVVLRRSVGEQQSR